MQTKYFVYLTTNLLFLLTTVLQITVGHQQLLIFGSIGWQKNLEITKMANHFSHTQKRILKLPKLKDIFFF